MTGSRRTLAQRAALALGVFFLVTGTIGLAVNPDFGTGSETSAEQFLIDWNGWHAVASLALAATAFVAAARPSWATGFQAYSAVANSGTAVWALFDTTPAGVLDLPNVATDVVLHFVVAGVSVAVLAVEWRSSKGRTAAA